jgi:hypothetical protein
MISMSLAVSPSIVVGCFMVDRQNEIREIFEDHRIRVNTYKDALHFEVEHYQITFDKLKKLSDLLGTTHINFDSGTSDSGCSTCGDGAYSMVEITCVLKTT